MEPPGTFNNLTNIPSLIFYPSTYFHRFGRKASFSIAAVIYMASGLLTTYAQTYILLIIGRIGLGLCGAGVFYSLFTLSKINPFWIVKELINLIYSH